MLRHRIEVLKCTGTDGKFGVNSGKSIYTKIGTVWAAVDFQRGMKSVREGAVDGTDFILVRMRYNTLVTRDCYLREYGVTYQITEFHASFQDNIIQIKAQEANIT
jgi:head-tail adaptor